MFVQYQNKKIDLEDYGKLLHKSLEDNYKILCSGNIPKSYIEGPLLRSLPSSISVDGQIVQFDYWRKKYITEFGFPLFAEDWVKPLAKWIGDRPCLEIMAGTGFFTYALSKYGCKVKATDNYSWNKTFKKTWGNVENLDCIDAIKKYGKFIKFVICSWPYMDDMAYKSLLTMYEINPKCRMIYIGEEYGGCTADDSFFDHSEFQHIEGFDNAVCSYRCWEGLHDFIWLMKYNPNGSNNNYY